MKKTIVALIALSGLAIATEDNFENLDLTYVSGNDYTLDMVLTTTDYYNASNLQLFSSRQIPIYQRGDVSLYGMVIFPVRCSILLRNLRKKHPAAVCCGMLK